MFMNSCFVSRAITCYLINLCMPFELPLSWYKYQLKLPQTGQTYQFFSSLLPSLSEVEKMKQLAFPTLLLVSLLLSSIFLQTTALAGPPVAVPSPPTVPAPPTKPDPMKGFCDSKCEMRCSDAGMHDRCIKYCGICCQRCKCVPSGTYGNKSECPCYRDMLSSQGRPKCP